MTFCYHMYGSDVAHLIVYVRTESAGDREVWRMTGDKGDNWFNDTVNPGNVTGSFSVKSGCLSVRPSACLSVRPPVCLILHFAMSSLSLSFSLYLRVSVARITEVTLP